MYTLRNRNNILIGAVHFPDTKFFYAGNQELARKNALNDARAFVNASFDALVIENNYDTPHTEKVDQHTIDMMRELGRIVRKQVAVPMGISVLWNDFKTALELANELEAVFIRVPVFVDSVKTQYGEIMADAEEVVRQRDKLTNGAVALFTDIHVKHAQMLSRLTLEESARLAIKMGSDGLIITGNWTGQAPEVGSVRSLRASVGSFPIIIGSGMTELNGQTLMKYANAAIVSTAVKNGLEDSAEVNVKSYEQRIDKGLASEFVKRIKNNV